MVTLYVFGTVKHVLCFRLMDIADKLEALCPVLENQCCVNCILITDWPKCSLDNENSMDKIWYIFKAPENIISLETISTLIIPVRYILCQVNLSDLRNIQTIMNWRQKTITSFTQETKELLIWWKRIIFYATILSCLLC